MSSNKTQKIEMLGLKVDGVENSPLPSRLCLPTPLQCSYGELSDP